MVKWGMGEEWRTPFGKADQAREKISGAISNGTKLRLELTPQEAACLSGVRSQVLKRPFSSLIQGGENRVSVLVAESEDVALEALRYLSEDKKLAPRVRVRLYRSLAETCQLSREERGQMAVRGMRGVVLRFVEEKKPRLKGLTEVLERGGRIPDADLPEIQNELRSIWDSLEAASRSEIAHLKPDNILSL